MPNILEWSIYLLLAIIGFILIWMFPTYFGFKNEDRKFILYGYWIKILGSASFVLLYFLYFQVGDTFLYHQGAGYLADLFWTDPDKYFQLVFSNPIQAQEISPGLEFDVPYSKESSFEEWFLVRLLSILAILCNSSYLVMTFFVSILSFIGSWHFYKFFSFLFPGNKWISFIASFLMPSVLFWGAGMLKDTVVLAFFGVFMYYFALALEGKRRPISYSIIMMIISGIIIFKLKSYVIIILIPCILYFLSSKIRSKIKNIIIKRLMAPALILVSLGGAFFLAEFVSNTTEKYKTDKLMKRAEGFHTTHTVSGSYYSLGEMEYSTAGVLRVLPAAINVSLFRPYPWEASSLIVLLSSVESLSLIFLFLYSLFYYRQRINYWIKSNNYFVLFISYTIIFGAVVGYISFNFGVLMRYKIPMIPFFAFTLLYYYKNRKLVR